MMGFCGIQLESGFYKAHSAFSMGYGGIWQQDPIRSQQDPGRKSC